MEVKKIVEGMTAQQVAQVIDENFNALNGEKATVEAVADVQKNVNRSDDNTGILSYPVFDDTEPVAVGDVRRYEGLLYRAKEAGAHDWDPEKWERVTLKQLEDEKLSELGEKVIKINSELYREGGINDISSSLVWSEGYQITAGNSTPDQFGTIYQISSGKRDASNFYELGDATSIVTTLIHPSSLTSNGGLVFYDANKTAIIGEGHFLNSNSVDAYTEVEIAIPSNAKYFRTTRWNAIAGVSGTFKCELKTPKSGLLKRIENLEDNSTLLSEEVNGMKIKIDGVEISEEAVDISGLPSVSLQLNSDLRWSPSSDFTARTLFKKLDIPYSSVHVRANDTNLARVFFTEKELPSDNAIQLVNGDGYLCDYSNPFQNIEAGTELEISVPSNAKYMYIWKLSTGSVNRLPQSIILYTGGASGLVGEVENLKRGVSGLQESNENQSEEIATIIGRLNKLEGSDINLIIGSPKIYQSEATNFGNINDLTVEQVYELYDDLVSLHPNYFFKREDLGTDSSGLYQLRHYTLRMGNPYVSSTYEPNDPSTNVWDDNTMSPRTICIVTGMHGNEKTSIYGVYLSVKEILESTEEWATFIRANFVLEICPIVNCWGVDNNSRPNFNGTNINRDFLEESPQAETALVKNLIERCHNLHVVLDSHNSTYVTGVGSVNLGYLPTNNTFRFHNYYCQVAAKLASALYPRMKELFNRSTQKPYIVAWISGNSGTLMDYVNNELNLIGGTLEAPNCDYDISDASLNNNSRWCEVTKDLLINTIQLYGCQEYLHK